MWELALELPWRGRRLQARWRARLRRKLRPDARTGNMISRPVRCLRSGLAMPVVGRRRTRAARADRPLRLRRLRRQPDRPRCPAQPAMTRARPGTSRPVSSASGCRSARPTSSANTATTMLARDQPFAELGARLLGRGRHPEHRSRRHDALCRCTGTTRAMSSPTGPAVSPTGASTTSTWSSPAPRSTSSASLGDEITYC